MSVRHIRTLSVALFGLCLVATASARPPAHSKKHQATASQAPTLIWRGDVATASGVMDDVADAWKKAGHGKIELQPFNTASGIDAVNAGSADLAGSARPAKASGEDSRLTFTPVAWDALVIIVQASNPVNSLSLKQVHDIYYGKIHNWNEVGGSNAPIDVYAVASPGDGVEYSLRSLLFGRGNQPVAAPRLYVNTHKLEEGVALNPNGMGASTVADMHSNSKISAKLKAVSINGQPPTAANIASGSYPLFTPLYLVTNPASPKAAQAQAFVDFLQSDPGKAALRKRGVLPYSDGSQLVAMDASRRSQILAEVGAHVSHIASAGGPGERPQASLAAVNTIAAAQYRTATPAKPEASLAQVDGHIAALSVTGVSRTSGDATTVNAASTAGGDFKQVSADTRQHTTYSADQNYTVVKGDTLSGIAHKYSVDVAQLRQWNHLKGDTLQLGQALRVRNN